MANKLKEMRIAAGLTQGQLAEYLHIDKTLLSRIETGERPLNLAYAKKIADLLNCSVDDLLSKEDTLITFKFTFNPKELSAQDLEAIAAANRILSNIKELDKYASISSTAE